MNLLIISSRKEETVLSRLHIGHTYVTHTFHLKGEEPPWCFACDQSFSLRHFMSECADLIEERETYFGSIPFKEIFKVYNGQHLFQFLHDGSHINHVMFCFVWILLIGLNLVI